MDGPEVVGGLPALVGIDALAVIRGERPGTSVVPNDSYFRGQETVLGSLDDPRLRRRGERVAESRRLYDDIHVDFDSLTEATLWEASERFGNLLQQLPEVQYLQHAFPGTCFAVPEWLRTPAGVEYGARVYFFSGDAPAPEEVLAENIAAVVEDARADFEAYLGGLHGYPDCCVEAFQNRPSGGPPPEVRAVDPLTDRVDEDDLGTGGDASIEGSFPGLFETPNSYAFYTREFYPEPDCSTARRTGVRIYDALVEILPEALVRDYFRFNFGYSYLEARAIENEESEPPTPGALGREHLYLYLPLGTTLGLSRYE